MRILSLISLILALAVGYSECGEYVPGTPGAPWTKQELLIVKSKLYSIFGHKGGWDAINQLGSSNVTWDDVPSASKMMRLTFHDCLRYTDGTGGCDGCLNWEGVGVRNHNVGKEGGKEYYQDVGKTNNNGLKPTVEVLEAVYTDPDYPKGTAPSLPVSLKKSGKSRADLWAFAGIAAMEYTMETNNKFCDGTFTPGAEKGWWVNPEFQCNQYIGTDHCMSVPTKEMQFKTGRADCTQFGEKPYIATKHEEHPNAQGNGKMTAEFFEKNFNFTGRETVAILGAHTLGQFHYDISLFRYAWTRREDHQWNNGYYKNVIGEQRYAWHDWNCSRFTDAEGRPAVPRWVVFTRRDTKNGGPVHWIKEDYQCHDTCKNSTDINSLGVCCEGIGKCKADSVDMKDDPDVGQGCERYQIIFGEDEMLMSSEMGLYLDFNVTDDGMPYGCQGLSKFEQRDWQWWGRTSGYDDPVTGKYVKTDSGCGKNTAEYPPGSTPLYKIFEEYAADNTFWIDEFNLAFDKMLSNGYPSGSLTLSPHTNSNVQCNRGSKYIAEWTECKEI